MDEKDKKKSPLNVQIDSKNRRKVKHTILKEQLSSKYGLSFQDNPLATARLANGLSSVRLQQETKTAFDLKTPKEIKKFEELNGFKYEP